MTEPQRPTPAYLEQGDVNRQRSVGGLAGALVQTYLPPVAVTLLGAVAIGWLVSQHPGYSVLLVLGIVGVVVGLLWLSRNFHTRAMIGALIFLTILRPFPDIGDPILVGRLIDLVWLALGLAIFLHAIRNRDRVLPAMWSGPYWLAIMTASMTVSLFVGTFLLQESIVWRDLFELYRGPYYLLILLTASQVRWNDEHLARYLFKPLVLALWVSFGVALLQGVSSEARELVSYVYTPTSAENLFEPLVASGGFTNVRWRNSGTLYNPNWYAVALSLVLPFLLAGLSGANSRLRSIMWLTSIAAVVFLGITGSRTGLVAGAVSLAGFLFWGVWRPRGPRRFRRMRGTKLLLALFLAMVAVLVVVAGPRLRRYTDTVAAISSGGPLAIYELATKVEGGRRWVQEALEESPLVGFGPSKSVSVLLGDNQYSLIIYRYGLLGLAVFLGFWMAIFFMGFRLLRRARSGVQAALGRAVLASVPAYLVACGGGAFFNAPQIATLYLLLVGIAFSSGRLAEGQATQATPTTTE